MKPTETSPTRAYQGGSSDAWNSKSSNISAVATPKMTDYNKDTVAQLRQILKDRGIPKQTPPAPTSEPLPETISHIDSDIPSPSRTDAIGQTAEDTTMADEPGALQPAEVFSAAPADPEDVVGPRVTEPADEEVEDEEKAPAEDELPEAPGPAAEALRYAQQERGLSENALDTTTGDEAPAADEKSSIEQAEAPPLSGDLTTQTSRLATEELEADTKKRKRRSGSPDMPVEEIKAKRPRPSQEPIHLVEDKDVTMEERNPEDELNVVVEPSNDADEAATPKEDTRREKKENTSRYKDLVQPTAATPQDQDAFADDRPIVPALHPATPALYIRDFMRPLRPEPLRAHLISLASPPSSSPTPDIIKALFLDAMKTHALVHFTSTTAASRVRASLHGSIWPPEGNRKELWVDFVPEEKVGSWIAQEEDALVAEKEARASGHPIPAKRFEVTYPESDDGSITAVFHELGSNAPTNAPRGPRASAPQPPPPKAPSLEAKQDNQHSFATLSTLFQTTTAKPQLYFLPVADDVSAQRLDELAAETSRDWTPEDRRKGRGIKAEMKYKYSFDERGRIVEVGEDRGPWSADVRGGGGGVGFRGRGGGRGRGRGLGWRG
ncbi:hypothetical protein P153DRAFT_425419 [Dothidotthia symphoricarpi CBS 119687]|uniref:SAP domain-containing protein n=1 Tax=Dothidotthia symphoricarpi CBS 119687 TaxID=1392245 RepID=A0A6A6A507_9PLEO|nr:uncharacterized protein P153DRAFT_425419 [Dothidotthia symphoricarpi CBS 119687]KAF2126255.1 hypothetical protein P153DRAFT_425419 [Dothidotthia symphoricarpi CBS 119687]